MTTEPLPVGSRVRIRLDSDFWERAGWFPGVVVRIEPYSAHRRFYWVRLDADALAALGRGAGLISVLNPRNIERIE